MLGRLAMMHLFCLASSIGYAAIPAARTVPDLANRIARYEKKIRDGYGELSLTSSGVSSRIVEIQLTREQLIFHLEDSKIQFDVTSVTISGDLETSLILNQSYEIFFSDKGKKSEFLTDIRTLFRLYRSQPEEEPGFGPWLKDKLCCFCAGGGCE